MADFYRLPDFVENEDLTAVQSCIDDFKARTKGLENWQIDSLQELQTWIEHEPNSAPSSTSRRLKRVAAEAADRLVRYHG